MIEILKQFIILIIGVFNTIFSLEIQLSDTINNLFTGFSHSICLLSNLYQLNTI